MQDDSSRNTIIFLVCALVLFIIYQMFVLEPAAKRRQAEIKARPEAAQALTPAGGPTLPPSLPPAVSRAAALAASPRVPVATPDLKGSISLKGARIDDLYLTRYRETVDKASLPVELLRPEGAPHAYFAEFGWAGANVPGLPTAATVWTLAQGSTLSPGQPVVLTYANGQGLTFTRRIAPGAAKRSRHAGPQRPDRTWLGRAPSAPAFQRFACGRRVAPGRRALPCHGRRERRPGRDTEHPAQRPKHARRPWCGGKGGGDLRVGQHVLQLPAIARRLRHQPDQPGKPARQPLARAGRTRPGMSLRRRPGLGPLGGGGETLGHALQPAPDQHQQWCEGRIDRSPRRHRPAQPRDDRGEAARQRGEGGWGGHGQVVSITDARVASVVSALPGR